MAWFFLMWHHIKGRWRFTGKEQKKLKKKTQNIYRTFCAVFISCFQASKRAWRVAGKWWSKQWEDYGSSRMNSCCLLLFFFCVHALAPHRCRVGAPLPSGEWGVSVSHQLELQGGPIWPLPPGCPPVIKLCGVSWLRGCEWWTHCSHPSQVKVRYACTHTDTTSKLPERFLSEYVRCREKVSSCGTW